MHTHNPGCELPTKTLQRYMRMQATTVCVQLEKYILQRSDAYLGIVSRVSLVVCQLSIFTMNKRLMTFCKEIERAISFLCSSNEHVQLKPLVEACLLLVESMSDEEGLVHDSILSVTALNSLRALRRATRLPQDARPPSSKIEFPKEFWASLGLAAEQGLGQLRTHERIGNNNNAAGVDVAELLVLFRAFVGTDSTSAAWSEKSDLSLLLYIELLSKNNNSLIGKVSSGEVQASSRKILLDQAQNNLLQLLPGNIAKNIEEAQWDKAIALEKCADIILKAKIILEVLERNTKIDNIKTTLEITRSYIRHLQCWKINSSHAMKLLLLCLLVIEQHSNSRSTPVTNRQLKVRCDRYIKCSRVQFKTRDCFTTSEHDSLLSVYREEQKAIEATLTVYVKNSQGDHKRVAIDSTVNWALARFSAAAFCMGDLILYELIWWFRVLYTQAIEGRVELSVALVNLLPKICILSQIQEREKKCSMSRDLAALMAAEEVVVLLSPNAARQHNISVLDCSNDTPVEAVPSEQLASFLSENIHELIRFPDQLESKPSELKALVLNNRRCILELNMLAAGARALNVDRVAELSEALEQVHSALCALPGTIDSIDLHSLLWPGHRTLRECLNRAAARQHIENISGIIAPLYRFLATGLPVVAPKWRRNGLQQRSRQLLAQLSSSFATLEALSQRQSLQQITKEQSLLNRLLAEHGSLLRQLQEELDGAERVHFGRVRSRLQRFVARHANTANKQITLHIHNEALLFRRETIASFVVPLQSLLQVLINYGVEDERMRRLRSKAKITTLQLEVQAYKGGISIELSDDGPALSAAVMQPVLEQIQAIGGELSVDSRPLQGNRIRLRLGS
ncbi:MAG: hypothetical protein ACSHXZ_03310 [Gammaproteobacteria bacterium]